MTCILVGSIAEAGQFFITFTMNIVSLMDSLSNEDGVAWQIKYFKIIKHRYEVEYW